MLKLTIQKGELFNENTQEFISLKNPVTLTLEHSLVSISKWEAKWKKSFLSTNNKTREETIDYVKCMTLTQGVDPSAYYFLSNQDIKKIDEYINDPMTATTFSEKETGKGRLPKVITSEQIYSWMVMYNIPFECQKWHLARLMVLIRICANANAPQKKMSTKEILSRNSSLNQARRAALHSRG